MESIWVTSLECVSQWELLLLLLPLWFHYYQLNYATLQRAESASFSFSFSFGLQSPVSISNQFQLQFHFHFLVLDTKIQCYDTKSMSQSSIAECWLHKWWRCLPLCIGPWCSIVRWCPIVQSEIHRVYTYIINAICGSKTSLTIERKWNRQKRFVISVDTSFICAIYIHVCK